MTARVRKLLGSILLIVVIIGYILLVSWVGGFLPQDNVWILLAFYAVAGIIWVFPMRSVMMWMNQPDPE